MGSDSSLFRYTGLSRQIFIEIGEGSDSIQINNLAFEGFSGYTGGVLKNEGRGTMINNCLFKSNSGKTGGVINNYNNSSIMIFNCVFRGNYSSKGSAIYNFYNCNIFCCSMW